MVEGGGGSMMPWQVTTMVPEPSATSCHVIPGFEHIVRTQHIPGVSKFQLVFNKNMTWVCRFGINTHVCKVSCHENEGYTYKFVGKKYDSLEYLHKWGKTKKKNRISGKSWDAELTRILMNVWSFSPLL